MAVIIGSEQCRVMITPVAYERERLPSVQCEVDVQVEGFRGRNQGWLAFDDLIRFIGELKELDRTRQGSGSLHSMSPGEFSLTIEALDRAGHLGVSIDLRKRTWIGPQMRLGHHLLSVVFEPDPTVLPGLIAGLEAVLDEA